MKFQLLFYLFLFVNSKRICELQDTCLKCTNVDRYSYYKCSKNSDCFPGEICQSKFCCPIPIVPGNQNKKLLIINNTSPIIPRIFGSPSIDEVDKKTQINATKPDIITPINLQNNNSIDRCPDGSYWGQRVCKVHSDCIFGDEICAEGKCCSSCKQRRSQVLKELATTDIYGVHIPQCTSDGLSYKSKQCKTATKDCWCVTPFGRKKEGSYQNKSRFAAISCENNDNIVTPIVPQNHKVQNNHNDKQNIRRAPQKISSYRAFVAECGFNEHYVPCQSQCQSTCTQQQIQECSPGFDCIPGCHCIPGFVRLNDSPSAPCVPIEQCFTVGLNSETPIVGQLPQPYQFSPFASQNCNDPLKEFHICGSSCPISCANRLTPKCQDTRCIQGCFCKIPYILENESDPLNSKCILPSQCPLFGNKQNIGLTPVINPGNSQFQLSSLMIPQKNINEQCLDPLKNYQTCGSLCPVACNNLDPTCSNQCAAGCFCRAPYILKDVHNPDSECILIGQCQNLPITTNNQGVRVLPSSMMRPSQSSINSYSYKTDQFPSLNIPHPSLSLELCAQDPKRTWTSCGGSISCAASCQNPGGGTCDQKHCTPGCACRSPYVLLDHTNPQSACVAREICPTTPTQPFSPTDEVSIETTKNLNSRCSDPLKEYRNCASSCPLGCNNLTPKQCAPCISGCFCKNGYIFEDALNWQISKCITMDNCPAIKAHIRLSENKCSDPFAEYNPCGSQCPEYCGQPSKPVCSSMCVPSCQCKPGYVRAQNYHSAPCVAITACTSLNSFLANEDKDGNSTISSSTTTTTTTTTTMKPPFITSPSALADLGIAKVLMSSETKDNLHILTYVSSKLEPPNDKLVLAIHRYGDISSSCTRIGEVLSIKDQPIILGILSGEKGSTEKVIRWNKNIDVLSLVGRAIALHNITSEDPKKTREDDDSFNLNHDMNIDVEEVDKIHCLTLTKPEVCYARCIANCNDNHTPNNLNSCLDLCKPYQNVSLCSDESCWNSCLDLGLESDNIGSEISSLKFKRNDDYTLNFTIQSSNGYSVLCAKVGSTKDTGNSILYCDTENGFSKFKVPLELFCQDLFATFFIPSSENVSPPSTVEIPSPTPLVDDITFTNKSLKMLREKFVSGDYTSNTSVIISVSYNIDTNWPLGENDFTFNTDFHQLNCAKPDYSSAIPQVNFIIDSKNKTLTATVAGDLMYRSCDYILFVDNIKSQQCNSVVPPKDDDQKYSSIDISCDTVKDNDCTTLKLSRGPICGQTKSFNWSIIGENFQIDPKFNITVNTTFDLWPIGNYAPIYYYLIYGNATYYPSKELTALSGVNITSINGIVNSCRDYDEKNNKCLDKSTFNSAVIKGLKWDTTYGVVVCAIVDQDNTTLPDITKLPIGERPKADEIKILSKEFKKNYTGLIVGLVVGSVALLFLCLLTVFANINRKQRNKIRMNKLKMDMMKKESEIRYKDFPKKSDVWELERRNLIIYDNVKLGSGAFGAVFLGKLIGKAQGVKDAHSALALNIMRTENCEVAVKMLPEYSDEMSKSEFLREIGLMKSLGYHERLVNMLACVTETEPYCLIVEYCSDGDLLQFLRKRCKYMLKLSNEGIDYSSPEFEGKFNVDLICTMKQLLMFAVQISYGLEYLSTKGFVHRDVAARNVLVHDGKYAKIGDFGLCRFVYSNDANYKSSGGKLPIKWMAIESIKHYEFTSKSDVWSFGILLFEIITLGGSPYPGILHENMLKFLESGGRMEKPDNCSDEFYNVMLACWSMSPQQRPTFSVVRHKLASQLEQMSDEYSYLQLNSSCDYYCFSSQGDSKESQLVPN
uniref:Thyroglobulin type-1 domain-containing protein n=1 Tax=Parastrongyloides trichosuri TaxID=131310 RepID=A0A0N5A2V1_PARTI